MKRIPTTQQISWFLDLDRNGQLDLNPSYQRKSVWSTKDKRFFLDTIFNNFPCPAIFVHRTIDNNGFATFHVVDGKQRLETILSFAKSKIAIDEKFGDNNLNSKKFNQLDIEFKRIFWDYTLVVENIESIEVKNIEEVFDRVNRNSMNLQPQELRHARFNGWFITETENESVLDFWWDYKVSTKAKDKRMKNVQFIAELMLIVLEKEIKGFSQDYLDENYAKYDIIDEIEEGFDEDNYQNEKNRIKSYIIQMDEHNQCVTDYAITQNHFYTLWALLALNGNSLPQSIVLAEKYKEFMIRIDSFSENNNLGIDIITESSESDNHLIYFINSKGATTEPAQRESRLKALKSALNI